MSPDGPVMLLVGGTGSIGGAIAVQALAAGWCVVIHGRREPLFASEDRVGTVSADLSEPLAARRLLEEAVMVFGRIDAVIDCVTGGPPGVTGRFGATDPQGYAGLLDASVGHFQRLANAALPWLVRQGGTLIAFASDAGVFAAPGQSIIGASRAAIIGFVRNLAVEVACDGVRVHCISPSYVEGSASLTRTEARDPARVAKARARAGLGLPTPHDIAPLVLFLCDEGAKRITGQVISINGGLNA